MRSSNEEIRPERTRAGLAQARRNGKRLGLPIAAWLRAEDPETALTLVLPRPTSPAAFRSGGPRSAAFWPDLFPGEMRGIRNRMWKQRAEVVLLPIPDPKLHQLIPIANRADQTGSTPLPEQGADRGTPRIWEAQRYYQAVELSDRRLPQHSAAELDLD
jgi:hypothetical protein